MIENLYTILRQDSQEVVLQLTTEHHPIFQAHFPNNPILPAFVLIDMMEKIFEESIINIKKSKFLVNILPTDILTCKVKQNEKRRNIKIFIDNKKVSEISYETK